MNLVFWHNIISPHQAPFMRELANNGHDVLVISSEEMSEERRQLGWDIPTLAPARFLLCSDEKQVESIVMDSQLDSIHLIAGARVGPLGAKVAVVCRSFGRKMGIITEAPDPRGFGGLLRRVKYSWERIFQGRHFDFILAMGEMGTEWFENCGYDNSRIFPFVYVIEPISQNTHVSGNNIFRFVFVGQLIKRKGVDLLLKAFSGAFDTELVIIGDGVEKSALQALSRKLGVDRRVYWAGKMGAMNVQEELRKADAMILPSRHDGWGAVVNESLMAGTPVICSSVCGASELIRYSWLGTVFKANDISSLQAALTLWNSKSTITIEHRKRVQNWSQCINGLNVAKYLEEVLLHVYEGGARPLPPWRGFEQE